MPNHKIDVIINGVPDAAAFPSVDDNMATDCNSNDDSSFVRTHAVNDEPSFAGLDKDAMANKVMGRTAEELLREEANKFIEVKDVQILFDHGVPGMLQHRAHLDYVTQPCNTRRMDNLNTFHFKVG